jgi:hypothetical protein
MEVACCHSGYQCTLSDSTLFGSDLAAGNSALDINDTSPDGLVAQFGVASAKCSADDHKPATVALPSSLSS